MRNYVKGESVINFWSNAKAPFQNLSNLVLISDGIEYEDIIYPSSEHAFQAQKYIKEQRKRFSINGELGVWSGLKLVYKETEYDKKYKYWSHKNNIGIIAKMVTKERIGKKLGLIRDKEFQSTDALWMKILREKYSIKYFSEILKLTEDLYLLEFDRFKESKSFWGGIIINNVLYGENTMGKYIMEIRGVTRPLSS